jgi:phenol hydroxylase P0 protein
MAQEMSGRRTAASEEAAMSMIASPAGAAEQRRYVRVRRVRPDGLVCFDFSIGDPALTVELILPPAAFEEFCANNRVEHLSASQVEAIDYDKAKWRYGHPGITE